MTREEVIEKAVWLSNKIGDKKAGSRRKAELLQELCDLVKAHDLSNEEIEDYAKDEHRRHREEYSRTRDA